MKARLIKILSLLLALASMLSVFSVFAFASNEPVAQTEEEPENGGATEEEVSPINVIYNRNFGEGWDAENGLAAGSQWTEICKGNSFTIDYEVGKDQKYNYFFRLENANVNDGHPQLNFDTAVDSLVIEFDVKVDDFCNTGHIYVCTQGTTNTRLMINLIEIDKNVLYVTDRYTSVPIANEWIHLAYVFDYTDADLDKEGKFIIKTYIDGEAVGAKTYETRKDNNGVPYDNMLQFIRVALKSCPAGDIGSNYCIDNLRMYSGTTQVLDELPADQGYGDKVNVDMAPTITILGDAAGTDSVNSAINSGLALKPGTDYCLLHGEKQNILTDSNGAACGTPTKYGDYTLVPLQIILDCIGYPSYTRPDGISIDISTGDSATYITLDRDNATVDGKRVELLVAPFKYTDKKGNQYVAIALEDIETLFPGWYVTTDVTGLIFITQKEDVVNSDTGLGTIMGVVQKFVFDFPDEEQIYEDVKEKTNNFDHPYIYANQDEFDEIRGIYNFKFESDKTYDAEFITKVNNIKNWVSKYITYANNIYQAYANPTTTKSEVVLVYDQYKRPVYEQATDENGELLFNQDGTPVYKQQVDENGDPVFDQYGSPVYVQKTEIKYTYTYEEYMDEGGTNLAAGRNEANKPTQPYTSSGGYDPAGGRMEEAGYMNDKIQGLAFAYQMTRDVKYAKLAYQLCLDMGEWWHWAPGHFLNTSQATMPMAQAYDWLYDIWCELGYIDVNAGIDRVAEIIYKFGVGEGLMSAHAVISPAAEIRRQLGFGSMSLEWRASTSNRNAVCSAGMINGALALLSYENDARFRYTYEGKTYGSAYLLQDCIYMLCSYGLVQYAPDGSYIESPGYWGYGTNHLCYTLMALYSSAGTDYGILDGVGMDQTFYFAAHVESSDFRYHNYHDSDPNHEVDSKNFNFAAWALDDPTISSIRMAQLANGKNASLADIFYYPENLDGADADLPLDYYAKGVDLYCSRSSWDKGAVYASMIGGKNNVSHGQIDAGSFVYHNAGQIWFHDIGKENYNVPNLGKDAVRYRYYRKKPEGNNTVSLTSRALYLPFGQDLNGAAYATDYYANEYGSYVVYNMAGVFGGFVNEARRGMLLTNDRKTTVVQDEISFKSVETIYWFGHYSTRYVNRGVTLSPDGKTAYMEAKAGGKDIILRVSIVSATNYKFEIMDTYTMVHDGWGKDLNGEDVYVKEADTIDRNETDVGGPNGEIDRGLPGEEQTGKEVYYKLAIKGHGVSFDVAVVMEVVEQRNTEDLGYEWTNMADWMPGPDTRGEVDENAEEIRNVKRAEFPIIVKDMIYDTPETHIRDLFAPFYKNLTHLQYIYEVYDGVANSYKSEYQKFVEYKKAYNAHVNEINSRSDVKNKIAKKLAGISI